MNKTPAQEQFGKTAEYYLTSTPHAKGDSLAWLLQHAAPKPSWRMLDVATGAGHVAYTFAPHVARVWATDITQEMLDIVAREALKRGHGNIRAVYARAESLPFEDGALDLVTCRIAPHHFEDVPAFMAEVARVLKHGGCFGLVDNIVPAGEAGDYINAYEMLRDPSHVREWTLDAWREQLIRCGFAIEAEATAAKPIVFETWAERHPAHVKGYLRAVLEAAPTEVRSVLKPARGAKGLTFELAEGMFFSRKH